MAKEVKTIRGVGKRKVAVARVGIVMEGTGKITVNGKDAAAFFSFPMALGSIRRPLELASMVKSVDVVATVRGGGSSAQVEAVRNAIAKALVTQDAGLRPMLKKAGYLTRDPRVKERKKYGLKKARRAPQFSKR